MRAEGKFTGSFIDRQQHASLPWQQRLVTMATYESEIEPEDNTWLQVGERMIRK